jgi:eukaryotic-like serine/threonine-protein kinase
MVGTVAYMAPERFGSEPGTVLTPAADIFAWGSVVGYAGMGRTPFRADSPPATAARILTQPTDLSGLSGPLPDLVAHALEKDPANRPARSGRLRGGIDRHPAGGGRRRAGRGPAAGPARQTAAGHRGLVPLPREAETPGRATPYEVVFDHVTVRKQPV